MSKSIIKQKRILTKGGGGGSISVPVSVANGGTGITSYTIGDLIYASGATTLSTLADVATGSVLVSGGVGVAPSWSTTLTLGVASATDGEIVLRSASNAFTTTIKTGVTGASYTLTLPTDDGSANQMLQTNGAGVLSWATPSSGITVGTTTITNGTNTRISFNDSGVYAEDADFTWTKASNTLTIGHTTTNGSLVFTGASLNATLSSLGGNFNYMIGSSNTLSGGAWNFFVGRATGYGVTSGGYNIGIGGNDGKVWGNVSYSLGLGWNCEIATNHEAWIGSSDTNGYYDNIYLNGKTNAAAKASSIRACGGSGSNNVAASLNLYAGLSTGSAIPAVIGLYSSAAGASSSTAQTAVKVLEITNSTTITTSDAVNYALGSTTGTKFGTATTQKLAFWNSTPVVQQILATGAAATVDDVITLLQTLGLCKQS